MDKNLAKDSLLEYLDKIKKMIQGYPYQFQVKKMNVDGSGHSETMLPLGSFDFFSSKLFINEQADDLLSRFVFGYLAKAKTLNYNDDVFNELFEELTIYETTGKYLFRTIGFFSEV